mmetsp:Transcript_17012/g.44256  ORF Transcript_17012/g.44256 Transcript_17012/m.44256 type:complete len:112 (-) Transcript_17012:82-417(-)
MVTIFIDTSVGIARKNEAKALLKERRQSERASLAVDQEPAGGSISSGRRWRFSDATGGGGDSETDGDDIEMSATVPDGTITMFDNPLHNPPGAPPRPTPSNHRAATLVPLE